MKNCFGIRFLRRMSTGYRYRNRREDPGGGKDPLRHKPAAAVAEMTENGLLKVTFDEPQRAVTKGQSVVLYDGDLVLGGGKICAAE